MAYPKRLERRESYINDAIRKSQELFGGGENSYGQAPKPVYLMDSGLMTDKHHRMDDKS